MSAPRARRVVVAVLTKPGARVEKGAALMAIEAMKVEHMIRAPADGTVDATDAVVNTYVVSGRSNVANITGFRLELFAVDGSISFAADGNPVLSEFSVG